ncbi:XRE family transcriptional regulator [Frondihabitans sp. PAMC 28766]|uniref:helix-turn-helix transcriptional regulator n=1 Tax=Frondihabitans sp. PAMC 28766 TaxID=1795630 RepID=UPI00078D881F|nr:helix-turn-helix transcriptional regulator [Frondihabitans sp. PAMC 28766]AMM21954.1 XRE family transcriptional regulator [Frondihabitans sp. PAMC 28766]
MPETHGDLAALLKSWRAHLSPIDVGLPAGGSRRAVGLRREELAQLAGLSVDYVVRLEQGRARNPSAQVVSSLARALQLGDEERDHLYVVAGLLPPGAGEVPRHIPPGVQRLVARLGESPIAVFSASWDLLTYSPLWGTLIGDPDEVFGAPRNLLRSTFGIAGSGGSRISRANGEDGAQHFERSLAADLRRVQGRYPDDVAVRRLVHDLTTGSERFCELWEVACVAEHVSERKTVSHPLVGDLEVDCDVLTVAGSDLRIVVYTVAANSPEAEKLDFLRVSALSAVVTD